jgi:hypothetical protein
LTTSPPVIGRQCEQGGRTIRHGPVRANRWGPATTLEQQHCEPHSASDRQSPRHL